MPQHVLVNVEGYIRSSVQLFVESPPTTESQRGFLAALLAVAHDVCLIPDTDPLIAAAYATLPAAYRDAIELGKTTQAA